MSDASKAVFLSYASQDAEPARRIADALRAKGVEVWFDQSELRGGDAWDQKIRQQIKECALFMPVISAATQARGEGYFRLEWKLAVDRSHLMADDTPFLFPVVIDDTHESAARVPDRFRDVQWTRLSVKDTPESLAARVDRLLGGESEAVLPRSAGSGAGAASGRKGRSKWTRYVWAGVGLSFALVYSLRPWWQPARRAEHRPAAVAAPVAPATPLSPARELAAKGLALARKVNSDRSDHELAEDFYKQALAADAFDGEIWAGYSQLCAAFVYRGFDRTPERREQVRTTAERALRLAPESIEAKLAMIGYYWQQRINLPDVEHALREILRQRPNDHPLMRFLSLVLRTTGRFDEGMALLDASAAAPGGDPVALADKAFALLGQGRTEEAALAVEASIAQQPIDAALLMKVYIDLQFHVNRAAALATYEALPTSVRLSDRGIFYGWLVYLWNRQPAKALELVQGVTRDYLVDGAYTGPRAFLTGYAQQRLGNQEAAAAEWRAALEVVEQHFAKTSSDSDLFRWRAVLLASLGQTAEAERALRIREQMVGFSFAPGKVLPTHLETIYLALGRQHEVVLSLKTWLAAASNPKRARQFLREDFHYDTLRGNPEFDALLVEPPAQP